MRKAIPLALTPEENGKLATIVRPAVATVRDVQRVRIVLLAAVWLAVYEPSWDASQWR